METFLVENMSPVGEHLVTGDSEADVLKTWRQMHLPRPGSTGRLDVVFLARDHAEPVLYLTELKNERTGKRAVDQVTRDLESWRQDANEKTRAVIANWLLRQERPPAEHAAARVALDAQGLLVAPSNNAEGIEAVGAWAKDHPEMPVQALKLLRFRTGDGESYVVLVDDVFIKPQKGQRVVLRWADLARHGLVAEDRVLVMEYGGRAIEAKPDFVAGRGKNLVPIGDHRKALIDALGIALDRSTDDWTGGKVREVARRLKANESVAMSQLSLYIQLAFGGESEPDWHRSAHLWCRRDWAECFVCDLHRKVR